MKEGPRDAVLGSRERRSVNKYRGRVWQSTLIDGVINHGATGLKVKRTGARHTPDRQSKGVFLVADTLRRFPPFIEKKTKELYLLSYWK